MFVAHLSISSLQCGSIRLGRATSPQCLLSNSLTQNLLTWTRHKRLYEGQQNIRNYTITSTMRGRIVELALVELALTSDQ